MQIVGMPTEIPTPCREYWGSAANDYSLEINHQIL